MRDLDTDLLNSLDSDDVLHVAPLAEFDFVEGMTYFWAGPEGHVLEYNGNDYTSIADLGQIDKLAESQGMADSRTIVSLRVDSEIVPVVGGSDSRGRDAKLILLFVDDDGNEIGPVEFYKTMGALKVKSSATGRGKDQSKIINDEISLELLDETSKLGNSHIVRMTYEQGLRIDEDDHGLEFVSDPEMSQLKGLNDNRGGRPGPRHGGGAQTRR